ncbi:MAG: hypothetical protein V2B14_06855 [bacterium]
MNKFIKALEYLVSVNYTNTYMPQNTSSNTINTIHDNENFSSVFAQLSKNIDNASINKNNNLYGYNSPNIDTIVQKIKENDNNNLDIDTQIKEYLLENYGGNKEAVIMNFSGVQNLPAQMTTMQDQIFNQIISKISIQVRKDIYLNNNGSLTP